MICPYCNANDDKVIDSRSSDGGKVIRRRRQCLSCKHRFTTYERVERSTRLTVIKRDGSRVPFSRENILSGVMAACGKRPISQDAKELLVDNVEETLFARFDREVQSQIIGALVITKLRDLDEISYIRFACEHYRFETINDVKEKIEELISRVRDVKDQQALF